MRGAVDILLGEFFLRAAESSAGVTRYEERDLYNILKGDLGDWNWGRCRGNRKGVRAPLTINVAAAMACYPQGRYLEHIRRVEDGLRGSYGLVRYGRAVQIKI